MSNSETPDAGGGIEGENTGDNDNAEFRVVVPLSSLSKKELKKLKSTVPETSANFDASDPGSYGPLLPMIALSAAIPLFAISRNVWVLIIVAITALALFGARQRFSQPGSQQAHKPRSRSVAGAREALKNALAGDEGALALDVHVVTYPHSNGVAFEIPALGARWNPDSGHRDSAETIAATLRMKQLDPTKPMTAVVGSEQTPWSDEWNARRPHVRERAGDQAEKLDTLLDELSVLLDPRIEAPADAEDTLATMRKDCSEAVVIYCEFAPTETNVVLRSGRTATGEVLQLLELVADEARRIRRQGTISKGDELSFLVRLNKARFTRSDLELP